MGDLGDNNAVQRRDGALDILDANKDIVEVVSRVATEWNADKTFAGLTNAIQANPDINMLISPSDSQDKIIEQVLKTAGKWHKTGEDGHVLFAGFDGDQNGYRLLSEKYMDVNGVQNLFYEVDLAYSAFKDIWAGKPVDKMLIDPGLRDQPGDARRQARRHVGLPRVEREEQVAVCSSRSRRARGFRDGGNRRRLVRCIGRRSLPPDAGVSLAPLLGLSRPRADARLCGGALALRA